jgi:hypothetical protein
MAQAFLPEPLSSPGKQRLVETSDRTPPYKCQAKWIDRFFKADKAMGATRITREFIGANVVRHGHQSAVLEALRFLGLIDKEGNTNGRLKSLRVVGDEFANNLASVVQHAYSELLNTVAIKTTTSDGLINFFMQKYSMSQPQSESAAHFFLHLASLAHMEVSESFSKSKKARDYVPSRIGKSLEDKVLPQGPKRVAITEKFDEGTFAVIEGSFGQFRIIDEDTLGIARKLLDLIEAQIKKRTVVHS